MNFLFVATILLSTNTSWFLIIFHSILFLVYECVAQISLKILIRLHFKLSFGLQIMFPLGLVFQATGISQMSGGPPHSRGWGGGEGCGSLASLLAGRHHFILVVGSPCNTLGPLPPGCRGFARRPDFSIEGSF